MPIPVPTHEPHKIKTVRPIAFPALDERKRNLAAARFNVFELTPSQITFDMVSYGTGAMSQEQLAGQLVGDEAYAGARNFETLERTINRVLGHTYVCPTHNTLGAVKLLVKTLCPPGLDAGKQRPRPGRPARPARHRDPRRARPRRSGLHRQFRSRPARAGGRPRRGRPSSARSASPTASIRSASPTSKRCVPSPTATGCASCWTSRG